MSPAEMAELLGGLVLVALVLADLARQFTLRPSWSPELDEPAFRAAAARLNSIGFGTRADPEASWLRFSALRAAYAPPLAALCDRFGIAGASWGA